MVNKIKSIVEKKTYMIYMALAAVMLVFMFYQGGKQSFWLDEMSLLGTITKEKNVCDILNQYLTIDVTNLPVFPLVAALWYRVLPANDRLMLLLPEIAVALSCIFSALTAELIAGKKSGIFAAILTAVSTKMILSCGFEFRSYGFLLFFGTGALYYFFKHMKSDSKRDNIMYGVMLVLTIYTHYMGAILIAALGAAELVSVIKEKSIKRLIPYVATGVLFAPWFVLMLMKKQKSITSFWPKKPTVPEIARVMRKLLSENEVLFIILIITFLYVLCRVVRYWLEKRKVSFKLSAILIMSWVVLFMLGVVFVYSAVINPAGGFFVQRYFLELVPVMLIIISIGISEAIEFISADRERAFRLELTAIAALFMILYVGLTNLREVRENSSKSSETFREASQWVEAQEGLYDEGTALVCSVNPRAALGFAEYYVRDGGKKPEIPVISLQDTDPVSDLKKYDKLYVVYVHRDMEKLADDVKAYLSDNFEIKENNEEIKAALYVRKEAN